MTRKDQDKKKFKEALGGNVEVSAPKLFDRNQNMSQGAFEFMGYNFKIIRRDGFDNKKQVVDAFRNKVPRFSFIDGTEVPDANWNRWIPDNVGVGIRGGSPFVSFGQQVEGLASFRLQVEFRHNYPARVAHWTVTVGPLAANPGNDAARLQTLRDSLSDDPRFQPDYPSAERPFPIYQRLGYRSIQEFLDGYHWKFPWKPPNLICTGRRHVYVVGPPVRDQGGNLLFNYYPDNDNPANVIETMSNLATANPALFQELFQTV